MFELRRRAEWGTDRQRNILDPEKMRVDEVQRLSQKELAACRDWFAEFDAARWDRQLEADIEGGKLDHLADAALADHAAGRSRKL
jgi:hypothetical protein